MLANKIIYKALTSYFLIVEVKTWQHKTHTAHYSSCLQILRIQSDWNWKFVNLFKCLGCQLVSNCHNVVRWCFLKATVLEWWGNTTCSYFQLSSFFFFFFFIQRSKLIRIEEVGKIKKTSHHLHVHLQATILKTQQKKSPCFLSHHRSVYSLLWSKRTESPSYLCMFPQTKCLCISSLLSPSTPPTALININISQQIIGSCTVTNLLSV